MQAMPKIPFLCLFMTPDVPSPHGFIPAVNPDSITSPGRGGELKTSCDFGAHQHRAGEPLPFFQPLGAAVSCIQATPANVYLLVLTIC